MRRLDFKWEVTNSIEMQIFRIRKKLRAIVAKNLQPYGLTSPQFFILLILKKEGSIKSTKLADFLTVKPSAITVFVDKLVEMDYVKRQPSESDRRVINLELKEAGKEILGKVLAEHNRSIGKNFNSFTEEELQDLMQKLETIENAADRNLLDD
ncbi:MarR family winged helix-turn-helix transcriptional regulator [Peribacillus muralis]|uniref:MarR family winged helix-turn-helix transcriptional regulator n=1 Tax=Peribacillus muralis TaxID=264697 RepID=UPI0007110040|nr:MarR family transcriptional regulator [Peribacillus muralis]MCK1993875.1 MarR family transcriptional regulator [Peribacillus muralis]MCK2014430.1 MarR family transcriptional regulator [Peribacillus muralis]